MVKLDKLLTPGSIAIIGASRTPSKVGHAILANLIKSGFAGELIPVNPNGGEILGLACLTNLSEYKGKVDLTLVTVAAERVKDAVVQAVDAGTGMVGVITSGFREVNRKGELIEQELVGICAKRGVRLLGPNCLGVINTTHRMNATFAGQTPPQGGISMISQSGALCTAILDWAEGRCHGFAKLVSIGNKADLSEIEFLKFFSRDNETRVIACYLESIRDGDEFVRAAETAAGFKPVVVYKAGVTGRGAAAVARHTGGQAGADMAYGAAFKRSGVIRAESFQDLFDYASAFSLQPLLQNTRIAVITNAGGPGVMAADSLENAGLRLTLLDRETRKGLRELLPTAASNANPVDLLGDAGPQRYASAFELIQRDREVDGILVILTPQAMTDPVGTANACIAAVTGEKPVFFSFMGDQSVREARRLLVSSGFPEYATPERAARAFRAMHDFASWRSRPPRIVTRFRANRRRVDRILRRHVREERTIVAEVDAKEILRAYGFVTPVGEEAASATGAVRVAERIGYPVVMKISSPDIPHKSDYDGVRLDLSTPAMIHDAFDLMMLRSKRRLPDKKVNGVYLERMVSSGREIAIGMRRDPQFGPMLMFGVGGAFVEVMSDVAFHLAPITAAEAMEMLRQTRSYRHLLDQGQGDLVDIEAVANALQRVSQLATDFPQIQEIEITPFMVGAVGGDSIVASAKMVLVDLELEGDEVGGRTG